MKEILKDFVLRHLGLIALNICLWGFYDDVSGWKYWTTTATVAICMGVSNKYWLKEAKKGKE